MLSGQYMNSPGSKVVTFLLKGIKTEKQHDALTADDNTSRIDPGSALRRPVKPLCDSALEREERAEDNRLTSQSMNPTGSKVVTILLKEVKIEKLHDVLIANNNTSIADLCSASQQPFMSLYYISL